MTATLSKSQAELPELVEIASQGEDVVITVDGKPKARLTRPVSAVGNGQAPPVDMATWLGELEEVRCKYATAKVGSSAEEILEAERSDRI